MFVPDAVNNFYKKLAWYDHLMDYLFIFGLLSGSLITFVLWFWVIVRTNSTMMIYKVAKIEMVVMLIVTYAISLSMDYETFILGHPLGMNS
ncbi:hypothetical protein GCM10027066_02660 [Dyella jejuensis]